MVKVRRFEMGASGTGINDCLQKLGVKVAMNGMGGYRIWIDGQKPRTAAKKELVRIIDQARLDVGLEPISLRHKP